MPGRFPIDLGIPRLAGKNLSESKKCNSRFEYIDRIIIVAHIMPGSRIGRLAGAAIPPRERRLRRLSTPSAGGEGRAPRAAQRSTRHRGAPTEVPSVCLSPCVDILQDMSHVALKHLWNSVRTSGRVTASATPNGDFRLAEGLLYHYNNNNYYYYYH